MQLVYFIVSISMALFSNICINYIFNYVEECLTHFKNYPEPNIASYRLKFLVLICQCQDQGVNLKKLIQV